MTTMAPDFRRAGCPVTVSHPARRHREVGSRAHRAGADEPAEQRDEVRRRKPDRGAGRGHRRRRSRSRCATTASGSPRRTRRGSSGASSARSRPGTSAAWGWGSTSAPRSCARTRGRCTSRASRARGLASPCGCPGDPAVARAHKPGNGTKPMTSMTVNPFVPPTSAQHATTPDGELYIWQPYPGIVLEKARGVMSLPLAECLTSFYQQMLLARESLPDLRGLRGAGQLHPGSARAANQLAPSAIWTPSRRCTSSSRRSTSPSASAPTSTTSATSAYTPTPSAPRWCSRTRKRCARCFTDGNTACRGSTRNRPENRRQELHRIDSTVVVHR